MSTVTFHTHRHTHTVPTHTRARHTPALIEIWVCTAELLLRINIPGCVIHVLKSVTPGSSQSGTLPTTHHRSETVQPRPLPFFLDVNCCKKNNNNIYYLSFLLSTTDSLTVVRLCGHTADKYLYLPDLTELLFQFSFAMDADFLLDSL